MSAFLVDSRFAKPSGHADPYVNMANRRAPAKAAPGRERRREVPNRAVFKKLTPLGANSYFCGTCPASASFAGAGGAGAPGAGAGVCFGAPGAGAGALSGGAGLAAGRPL